MNNTLFVAVLLMIFPFLTNGTSAEETTSQLSVEELKTTAQIIRALEDTVCNVRIDSEAWVEKGPSPSGPWERTPVCWSTTAYYGRISTDQARIDVHKSVAPWKNGAAPYIQNSYSISFDGVQGKRKEISSSYSGKIFDRHTAYILPDASWQITGFSKITGIEASLFFHYRGVPEPLPERFSANFEAIADPNTFLATMAVAEPSYSDIKPPKAKVVREEFKGKQCIKMISMADSGHTEWWLDPDRGFALLRMDLSRKDETGNFHLKSSINVTKLEKVTENIWWPAEAYFVECHNETGKPCERIVYAASNVVVNDPNFDESVFTLEFPKGYEVKNEVTGKTYTVGEANQ